MIRTVNLAEMFERFPDFWSPKIVGDVNDVHVKLVKLKGEFVWHHHDREDELFFVLEGTLLLDVEPPGGRATTFTLERHQAIVVPHGVRHRTRSPERSVVLMVEPASVAPTGD